MYFSSGEDENKTKDVKDKLKEAFKVDLPQDFFDFWEFCKKINSENPCGKSKVQLVLVITLNMNFIYTLS